VFSLEVRDEEVVERTVEGVLERFGRLDVMVNSAGLFERGSYWNSPERTGMPCSVRTSRVLSCAPSTQHGRW
jgi:NAD(P)-dependent dehydrogenase (short-subunit alcohol dehydrogenase family)